MAHSNITCSGDIESFVKIDIVPSANLMSLNIQIIFGFIKIFQNFHLLDNLILAQTSKQR